MSKNETTQTAVVVLIIIAVLVSGASYLNTQELTGKIDGLISVETDLTDAVVEIGSILETLGMSMEGLEVPFGLVFDGSSGSFSVEACP